MADRKVNEDLYNWINKTYGIQPAEWYRNNPQRPSESNPFLPRGSYVPKASADDPYRGAVASTQDPYKNSTSSSETNKLKTTADYTDKQLAALPFDQLLQVLAATPNSDYEELAKVAKESPTFQPQNILFGIQKIGGQFTPVSEIPQEYYYQPLSIVPYGIEDTGPIFRKYLDDPQRKTLDDQYDQALKRMWSINETNPELAKTQYLPVVDNLRQQGRDYAYEFSNKYAGTLRDEYQDMSYGTVSLPSRADLQSMQNVDQETQQEKQSDSFQDLLNSEDFANIASADWPSGPRGPKLEPPIIPATDPKLWPMVPKVPPRFPKAQQETFESAVAKALPQSDKKRQMETFQSEYDPQQARAAAQAANKYRIGSDNADPFRNTAFA